MQNLPRAISFISYASEISPPLERIVIDSCPRAFRHTGVSSPMSAAMTAASAVASATAGRAAGRPRANAKVRLRPVPPGRIFGARFGSHFLLSGERCLAAPRARRVASPPDRRPAAFRDGRDRAATLDAREKPPLPVVPSVLRARAPARSRSPTRSARSAVGWTSTTVRVRRRFARAGTPLTPRPPPETGRASRPQVRRHSRAQRGPPRHGASPSRAARGAARRIRRGYFRRFETARPYAKNAASGACFTWRARHVMLRTRT